MSIRPTNVCPRAHTGAVWTHLEPWLVQTGELPQLEVGDVLRRVALRAACWSIQAAQGPEGIDELPGLDPSGDPTFHYALTGVAAWAREPGTILLRVGALGVLAEPREVRATAGSAQRYSPTFRVPPVGEEITVVAGLVVMAPYETETFDYPDVRRDWRVRGLKVEHRQLVASTVFPDTTEGGPVERVVDIPRMLRWADAPKRDHATYLVDLVPEDD